jgi:hypothetical protein
MDAESFVDHDERACRACMTSVHGFVFNARFLEWRAATHVRQVGSQGYRPALIDKSHLQHGMSRNSIFGGDAATKVAHGYPEGWDELEHFVRFGEGVPDWPDDFYGVGHVEPAIDHGAGSPVIISAGAWTKEPAARILLCRTTTSRRRCVARTAGGRSMNLPAGQRSREHGPGCR